MPHSIHKRAKIIGQAGTGKTSYLLNLIEAAAQKYDPERIGAVSLTVAAIEEMRDRVFKTANVPKSTLKNIHTIHSTCFRLLSLKREQVADKKIKEFNEAYPAWAMPLDKELTENNHYDEAHDFTPKENKKRFAQIQILRHKLIPESEWSDPALVEMFKCWKNWMLESGYTDFTGMMEDVYFQGLSPDIDILLVDEAQDVSKLAISILELWGQDTISTVYVGDSDQAILRFAGAVPEAFINLENTWVKILEQSYRVPRKVHEYAMRIIRQAEDREDVEYRPKDEEGEIILGCTEPDLSLPGTHMIIGRCNYHLNRWRDYLMSHKLAWHNPYRPGDRSWNPLNTKAWGAAKSYVRIKNGEDIEIKEFRNMVQEMMSTENLIRGAKTGLKGTVFEDKKIGIFGLISMKIFTDEFLSFKKPIIEIFKLKGQSGELISRITEEDVVKDPQIILGTIHSVKGGEGDHVWIDLSTSPQCVRAMISDKTALFDEARVAYVAVTRAKKTVGLLKGIGYTNKVLVV